MLELAKKHNLKTPAKNRKRKADLEAFLVEHKLLVQGAAKGGTRPNAEKKTKLPKLRVKDLLELAKKHNLKVPAKNRKEKSRLRSFSSGTRLSL